MVALESAELFRRLKAEELQALRQLATEQTFAAGAGIFREGDGGDGVYVVRDGLVEISGMINQDTRRVFSQIGPGGLFGEMAVIEQRPRSATATAVQDSTVYFFARDDMLSFLERSPGFALSLLQVISHRLREFNQYYLREVVQTERLAVIGRFARSIVHDLKNPLNIIGLTTEMACRPEATPEFRVLAQNRVQRQVERINELVSEIIYFTQATETAVSLTPTDFAEFVGQLAGELREEAAAKSAKLDVPHAPPAVRVRLNPQRLRRVFFNLVHNAADAMRQGGPISLRFKLDAQEVITEISDTGPGIAPEMTGRLFQAFATHGKAHGTGLGLSICKKIIEDHHGRIWAGNASTGGAVFSFALPVVN